MSGMVYLVGAGPGDPGLFTVKGLELIKKADCIVYDRLSSPELLDYARQDCECIYAGKAEREDKSSDCQTEYDDKRSAEIAENCSYPVLCTESDFQLFKSEPFAFSL